MNNKLLMLSLFIGMVGLYLMLLQKPLLRIIGVAIILVAGAIGLKAHGKI